MSPYGLVGVLYITFVHTTISLKYCEKWR